jgi:hypothetical protein
LYQDNYVGTTIDGISDRQWVQARSGFVVELGDADQYGSFQEFQNAMLAARVKESVEGFIRDIRYERPGLSMEMKWHCYEEKYLVRRINGRDDPWVRHVQSPEFAVGSGGTLRTHDAELKTRDETLWLISCSPSRAYVAYQPHPHRQLPLDLTSPVGRVRSDRFPFGKLVLRKTSPDDVAIEIDAAYRPFFSSAGWRAEVWQKLGTLPSKVLVETDAQRVTATINGQPMPVERVVRDGHATWVINPYARIPRAGDRAITR